MRLLLAAVALAGCVNHTSTGGGGGGGGGGGDGGGWTPPPGPPNSYGCESDAACGTGNLCARDGECLPAGDVRAIHVTWTLQGATADQTSCARTPSLEIDFTSTSDGWWGYAPVPCVEGKFTIDKLPIWYSYVELGRDGDTASGNGAAITQTSDDVAIDLPY